MSNYTQEQQTKFIKDAMTLTTAIQTGEEELRRQEGERFKSKPMAPTRKVLEIPKIQPQIPEAPKTKYSYDDYLTNIIKSKFILIPIGIFIVLFLFFILIGDAAGLALFIFFAMIIVPIIFIVSFIDYSKKKKDLNQKLAQSPEYIKSVEEAKKAAEEKQQKVNEDIAKQQAEIDAKYKSDIEQYDTVIMPKYKAELAAWTTEHDKKVQAVTDKLEADRRAQSELYETSKIIPMQYRGIEALTYIYQLMATSEYDLKESIDMYDKKLQRQQEEARIRELQRANNLADEQNYHLMQQNELLNDQNELQYQQNAIAEKQRKDDRRREIEAEYHRHQIRKNLKNSK